MSSTLTWASSGNGSNGGASKAQYINDLDTLVTSKAGNSAFYWQKAGKNTGADPWLLLKRKSGAAGRILIISFDSSPTLWNPTIWDQQPSQDYWFILYFPAGTANTVSNYAASSGTVCGDDTGTVKAANGWYFSTYSSTSRCFYFDCQDGMFFGIGDPAGSSYGMGAGELLVDAADNAYGCTFGPGNAPLGNFGNATGGVLPWSGTPVSSGGGGGTGIKSNFGSSNRTYYSAWTPSGNWASQTIGPNDVLSDTSTQRLWFVQYELLACGIKGEGFVLKLRQIAYGPGTTGPYTIYNTTGPVLAAIQVNNATAGGNGFPWVTNFKL